MAYDVEHRVDPPQHDVEAIAAEVAQLESARPIRKVARADSSQLRSSHIIMSSSASSAPPSPSTRVLCTWTKVDQSPNFFERTLTAAQSDPLYADRSLILGAGRAEIPNGAVENFGEDSEDVVGFSVRLLQVEVHELVVRSARGAADLACARSCSRFRRQSARERTISMLIIGRPHDRYARLAVFVDDLGEEETAKELAYCLVQGGPRFFRFEGLRGVSLTRGEQGESGPLRVPNRRSPPYSVEISAWLASQAVPF